MPPFTRQDMEEREALHSKLLKRVTIFKPKTSFAKEVLDLALAILEAHNPNDTPEPKEILDGVRDAFPPARSVFTDEFFTSPLFPIAFLRDTMAFYSSSPTDARYVESLKLPEGFQSNSNITALVWLSSLLYLSPNQAIDVITTYGFNCLPANLRSFSASAEEQSGNNIARNQTHGTPNATPAPSEKSESETIRRLEAQDQKLNEISEFIQGFNDRPQRMNHPGPITRPQEPSNRATHQAAVSYSSVGFIPQLPLRRSDKHTPSGGATLLKAYSHPSQQFSGYGDIEENLAIFHQSFMSKCRTLQITEPEAFDNMHVLFKPNSPASIFYHKHVQPNAHTLQEAFNRLYARFLSSERRDRLVHEWNNLQFSEFASKPGLNKHAALRQMCTKASMMQLQLGPSYQDDQHLRDALMNACKYESWAHRLAAMSTSGLLDIQESLARAITADENLKKSQPSQQVAAFTNNINYNKESHDYEAKNRTNDRHGMASRRYGRDNRLQSKSYAWNNRSAPDGKNPIRNHMRMLCRKCDSDSHLLRNCPDLTKSHKNRFAKHILCVETICSDSEDCLDALDMIQDFSDDRWSYIESLCMSPADDEKESNPNIANFASKVETDIEQSSHFYTALADVSFSHSLTHDEVNLNMPGHHEILFNERTKKSEFEGICMDNGAQKSLAGLPAYKRYCEHSHNCIDLVPSSECFKLGKSIHKSIGSTVIRMPIDETGNYLEYETDVINVDIPILFGLDKMKELKWHINEVTNEFCSHENPNLKMKLSYEKGHLYLKWPTSTILFSRQELIRIHQRFAHPSARKLTALIKRANPSTFDSSTRSVLEDIAKNCNSCQRIAPKPLIFQVTMPDKIVFNHEIYMDLTWIEQRPHPPALHIVDRGTHFSAAKFVQSESTESIWNAFLTCWVSIYVGFPNVLSHDQGTLFMSNLFQESCAKFGIITKPSPTESHNALGAGERYHAPLRNIYRKIKIEYPTLNNHTALSIATYGLNSTANPEGLIPTLLVFGSIPKIPLGNVSHLPPNQRLRFKAMEVARREMESIVANQRIMMAKKKFKGKAMNAFEVCPGSEVLVYREKKKCWDGPYKLEHYDNYKTAFVEINGEVRPFSITAVKKYNQESEHSKNSAFNNAIKVSSSPLPLIGDKISVYWPIDARYYSGQITGFNQLNGSFEVSYDDGDIECLDLSKEKWKFTNDTQLENKTNFSIVKNPLDPRFVESTRSEIKGLLERGACIAVRRKDIPSSSTILRTRVIHSIKDGENGKPKFKTRIVVMGHTDPEKSRVVNEAPTILRSSVRVLLTLCNALDLNLWSRDVTQAFLQSTEALSRDLFVLLPTRPDISNTIKQIMESNNNLSFVDTTDELALKVIQPWYGLSDSPGYWWQTYKRYHISDLQMRQSILDPCLFFKKKDRNLTGIIGTLVDDTLGAGSIDFEKEENESSAKFDSKPKTQTFPFKFNGAIIDNKNKAYSLTQIEYVDSIKYVDSNSFSEKEFAHARGQIAYVATNTRPDIAFLSAQLSQVVSSKATEKDAKLLNTTLKQAKSAKRGLVFPKLDKKTIRIHGYADASFANNSDLTSQLGMVIILIDDFNNASIVHYASWKCRRVTRSILAAEVYALSGCFDYCYTLARDLEIMLDRKIQIHLFTDSKSIFDTVTKLSSVSEKRLLIDISALRQSYSKAEIDNIGHILSEYNIADALTKQKKSKIFDEFLRTGKLQHPVNQWIIHTHCHNKNTSH